MESINVLSDKVMDSEHSYLRSKQRCGLKRKKASRMMDLARERGITYEDCRWSMDRKYLQKYTNDDKIAVAYNGFCYILKRESRMCITLFELPRWFGHKKRMFATKDGSNQYLYTNEIW